jgi:light-harvesting complex I chlorophyll a/b binding protein 1
MNHRSETYYIHYVTKSLFIYLVKSTSSIQLNAFAGGLPGNAGPELKNFDPLKFSEKSPEWVPFFREAEIKHGRIAMLATLGWIVADFVKLPGDVHLVSSLDAHTAAVKSGALIQILLWLANLIL